MQARQGALGASLALGAIWGCWHLPLFFVPGSQRDIGFPSYLIATLTLRIVLTWVFNNTGGSVLLVSLMHQALNVWTDLLGPYAVPVNWWLAVAWQVAVAAVLVLAFGATRLSRKPAVEMPDAPSRSGAADGIVEYRSHMQPQG